MFGYREPFHISSPGKQDLEYKIITFKIFRVRKTKSSVYKQNLFRFPCPETAVPTRPEVVSRYRLRLSPGRQPLVNNLLILIQASGYSVTEKPYTFSVRKIKTRISKIKPFYISGSGKQSVGYISKNLFTFSVPEILCALLDNISMQYYNIM